MDWRGCDGFLCHALLAYWPALHGAQLWDDDGHVTKPALRSLAGLKGIWTEVGATQQYYPVLHSAFWVEHRLWGDAVIGYHLVNVLLHAASALLVMAIMRRLALPGAWLGGLIFALHPVGVESVAWITEQKNTLSAFFYLGAAFFYLDFDQTRRGSRYFAAALLFVLALFSKTVTATLPAALLVVFWWRRGRLDFFRDVLPLLPWFALSACSGLVTAWVEKFFIGAHGADFGLTFSQRVLLAGRALWFYADKLCWPGELVFIYPRWQLDPGAWCAMVVSRSALWRWREVWSAYAPQKSRAARRVFVLCRHAFSGAGFRQRLSISVFVRCGSFPVSRQPGDHRAGERWTGQDGGARDGVVAPVDTLAGPGRGLLLLLGTRAADLGARPASTGTRPRFTVTRWRKIPTAGWRTAIWAIILERRTRRGKVAPKQSAILRRRCGCCGRNWPRRIAASPTRSPRCPAICPRRSRTTRRRLRLAPGMQEAHNNLGIILAELPGEAARARAHFEAALRIDPGFAEAHVNLGTLLSKDPAQLPAAVEHYEAALAIDPDQASTHYYLGNALAKMPAGCRRR